MAKLMAVSETDPGIAVIMTRVLRGVGSMVWSGECTECGETVVGSSPDTAIAKASRHVDNVHG